MRKNIKRILALSLIASILIQVFPPEVRQIQAQAENRFSLTWNKDNSLNTEVGLDKSPPGKETELVSWDISEGLGEYILEYYVEDEKNPDKPAQKIEFSFDRDGESDRSAEVRVKTFTYNTETKEYNLADKSYSHFDFGNVAANKWIASDAENEITIPVREGSNYPGGRIRLGAQMEIRYRWDRDKVYVQTNNLKAGNITPFSLRHKTINPESSTKVEVLADLEDYAISPVHIEIDADGNISNKDRIVRPGEEEPGSKPGLKVNFKKPKKFNYETSRFYYPEADKEDLKGTLVLAGLTGANAQFEIDFATREIKNSVNKEKEIIENNNKYTVYFSQEEINHKNILTWKELEESLLITEVELGLSNNFGIFTPRDMENGYTYLGFDIKKSSFQDAYLDITPYKGTGNKEYTYVVYYSEGQNNWKKIVEHKHKPTGDEEGNFTIPVPFKPNSGVQYYQIKVEDELDIIESQILQYHPDQDQTIPPPIPTIQTTDNIYVVPPEKLGEPPQAIGFDITWRAPRNTDQELSQMLEKGDIYYELFLDEKNHIKTFKASLEDGNIVLKEYAGTAGKEGTKISTRYNSGNDTFTMENVVLKNPGKNKWENISGITKDYEKSTSYPSLNEITIEDNLEKKVPGIYYLSMRALYDPHDIEGQKEIKMGLSGESNPKSISISSLEEIVPVSTKINSKNIEDISGNILRELSWNSVDLNRYKQQMLDPIGLKLEENFGRTYEIYLYTDKNIKEENLKSVSPASIYLSNIEETVDLSKDNLKEDLRSNKAIRFDYSDKENTGTNNIKIENLDPNQVYYMSMRVRLDLSDQGGNKEESRYSIFSKQHTFTSYISPNEPEPSEKVPPVPGSFKIISQENNTSAILGWEAPDYKKQDDEEVYYELVKIDSREMLKDEDSRLLDVETIVDKAKEDEIQAWSTEKAYTKTYEKNSGKWLEAIPKQEGDKLRLEDISLKPNNIYYYYVRTVILTEGERVKSSWVGIPVTTDPVKKPIQLKVENHKDYDHKPKEEIVISFMAPLAEPSRVPEDYDFDIAVQSELDDEYKFDYKMTKLGSKERQENIPEGYSHFVYKIEDLRPGKRYDIKVRIIDKTTDKINNQYPKSLYSDRVTARTSFDQDEQDKEDKFSEYIQYFEDRAEALRRKPYWQVDNKKDSFSLKYRDSYLAAEMKDNTSYSFAVEDGTKTYEYYIPVKSLEKANLNKTSFQIVQGGLTYVIRPETITKELEEIRETIIDINDKRIKDYYVLFSFDQGNTVSPGNITPEAELSTRLIQLSDQDFVIEDDIMINLNKLIEKEKKIYIDDLENALDRGRILKEDLDPLVDKALENIQEDHKKDVRGILGKNTSKTLTIKEWNKSMLVLANNILDAVGQGYYKGLNKENIPSFRTSGGYALEADKPGIYGFSGRVINIQPIPGAPGSRDLVIKYGLDEFFGYGGYINPSGLVTKRQLLGASAKVLGASKGADYNQYLRQAGIKGISNIGQDQAITKGEAIYFLMQVYEKTLGRPINAVYIQNRNSVPNLWEFNQIHQPYVLLAADAKLISGPLRPRDNMKTEEVLQILTNILKDQR